MNIWTDSIYSGLRCVDVKLCALVVIGVNEHRQKRLSDPGRRGSRIGPELERDAFGVEHMQSIRTTYSD